MGIISAIRQIKKIQRNKLTRPSVLGEKIMLLLSAPSAQYYFDYKSVRDQFKDYDLAVVNYMPVYSAKEMRMHKPKFFFAIDPGLYSNDYFGIGTVNTEKEKLEKSLKDIDWDCYLVTSVLEDFNIENPHVMIIHLTFLETTFARWKIGLLKRNYLNLGASNVVQAALFFAITFGYKTVAILGCPYRNLKFYMEQDGLHIDEHNHYYALERDKIVISNDELFARKIEYSVNYYSRALKSSKIMLALKKYAEAQAVDVTNYSEGSMITTIKMGKLDKSYKD